jgi:hypothetical protein
MENKKLTIIIILLAIVVGLLVWNKPAEKETSLGFAGLTARVASTTDFTLVAATATRIFATTTCVARIVSTNNSAMITFSDFDNAPTLSHGTQHATGTTAYDAETYGCGAVNIFSPAVQSITVTDVQ